MCFGSFHCYICFVWKKTVQKVCLKESTGTTWIDKWVQTNILILSSGSDFIRPAFKDTIQMTFFSADPCFDKPLCRQLQTALETRRYFILKKTLSNPVWVWTGRTRTSVGDEPDSNTTLSDLNRNMQHPSPASPQLSRYG